MNLTYLDENDVLRLLRAEIEQAGSQAAWARRTGVDRTFVNAVVNRRKPIARVIIKALGLNVVYARRK